MVGTARLALGRWRERGPPPAGDIAASATRRWYRGWSADSDGWCIRRIVIAQLSDRCCKRPPVRVIFPHAREAEPGMRRRSLQDRELDLDHATMLLHIDQGSAELFHRIGLGRAGDHNL